MDLKVVWLKQAQKKSLASLRDFSYSHEKIQANQLLYFRYKSMSKNNMLYTFLNILTFYLGGSTDLFIQE